MYLNSVKPNGPALMIINRIDRTQTIVKRNLIFFRHTKRALVRPVQFQIDCSVKKNNAKAWFYELMEFYI